MKTLYEVLKSLSRELFGCWQRPRRHSARQAQPYAAADPPSAGPAGLPAGDLQLDTLARDFPRELFAQLLIELPACRQVMSGSYASGNYRQLRDSIHQLLGAVAYCQASELEQVLRQLRMALQAGNSSRIEQTYNRAMHVIDSTLHNSGFRVQPE